MLRCCARKSRNYVIVCIYREKKKMIKEARKKPKNTGFEMSLRRVVDVLLFFSETGFVRSNRRRYFRGITGGSTLERAGSRQLAEKRSGLRPVVSHGHEKNAFRYGGRSLYSRENTERHRERRIEHERRIGQVLVSGNIVD